MTFVLVARQPRRHLRTSSSSSLPQLDGEMEGYAEANDTLLIRRVDNLRCRHDGECLLIVPLLRCKKDHFYPVNKYLASRYLLYEYNI